VNKSNTSLLLAIGWFIISVILLTLPGSAIPKEDWLGKIWIDRWVHIGMFSIMVFLWCKTMLKMDIENKKLKIIFFFIAEICFGYGIGMEFVQKYFIPNRSFDVGDIIADAIGCSVGLVYSIRRYIKK